MSESVSYVKLVGEIERKTLKASDQYHRVHDCPKDAQFVLATLENGHIIDHTKEFNPFYKIVDGTLWYYYIYGWGVSSIKYPRDFLRERQFLKIIN